MDVSPYEYMQMAVDIIPQSAHLTSKVAATLCYHDHNGITRHINATNYWPPAIEKHIGTDTKVGNSSGTVHAETACILAAPCTKGSTLFITDPPCPNCAKNIAEAGIKTLYIDHKGFEKDFAERRGEEFKTMSMRIFEHAGISVYEIRRKEQKITPVLEIPEGYAPLSEHPLQVEAHTGDVTNAAFKSAIAQAQDVYAVEPFALAFAQNTQGQNFIIHARRHPVVGYTHHDDLSKDGKYSYILQPVNRLLVGCKYYELTLHSKYLFSSRVPTSREFVNMIGAGMNTLTIGHETDARDEAAHKAIEQLKKANILTILNL